MFVAILNSQIMVPQLSLSGRRIFAPGNCIFERTKSNRAVKKRKYQNFQPHLIDGRRPGAVSAAKADSASHGKDSSGDANTKKAPLQGLKAWWRQLTGHEGERVLIQLRRWGWHVSRSLLFTLCSGNIVAHTAL